MAQQTIRGIDADTEAGALLMVLDDVEELGEKDLESLGIARGLDIAVGGVEEPEGGIGSVVKARGLAFGKHIRDEAIADVLGEAAKDVFGFTDASGSDGEAFERDHRVAAPVREPVITGDHGADLIADAVGLDGVRGAADGRNEELVGGENELGGDPGASLFRSGAQETAAAFGFRGKSLVGESGR